MMNRRFLSTLSLRRATTQTQKHLISQTISIHALLAESDNNINNSVTTADNISIHALLAESDALRRIFFGIHRDFYPRSPCGERLTGLRISDVLSLFLSTLSLRRATYPAASCRPRGGDFYPRSPCGERPSSPAELRRWCEISIHALLAESDHILKPFKVGVLVFLSTLSLRRATRRCARSRQCAAISIHALLAESDR